MKHKGKCHCGMMVHKAIILGLFGLAWLGESLGWFMTGIPWGPAIIILIALKMLWVSQNCDCK